MIDQSYKVTLLGRMANSVEKILLSTDDINLAEGHINRLKRLRKSGHISTENYQDALAAAKDNPILSEALSAFLTEEIGSNQSPLSSKDIASTITFPSTNAPTYESKYVLLPGSHSSHSNYTGWNPLDEKDRTQLLEALSPIDERWVVNDKSECHWHFLPWYDEKVALIRLKSDNWSNKNLAIYYLAYNGVLKRLNGTSPAIHELNVKASIVLNQKSAADYLRFFSFFVRGEGGPFYLLERADDPFFTQAFSEVDIALLEEHIRPLEFKGLSEKGDFLFSGLVFYSNALFEADYAVNPTGMIEMLDDNPVASNLDSHMEAPLY